MNVVLDTRPSAEVSDVEIVAHVVRLCRAARPGVQAKEVFSQVEADFPDAPASRLRACIADAAQRLMKQHDK